MHSEPLDPVIHAPARLRIVATLATLPDGDELSFTRLQDILTLTPGNLITHLRKLEDAGYISIEKSFLGRKPLTQARITDAGRAAFARWLDTIGALVDGRGNPA